MLDMNSTLVLLTAQKASLHMDGMVCEVLSFICSDYHHVFFVLRVKSEFSKLHIKENIF